ncbi:MAG: MarR family transcriptional regulator [Candidatus Omnitrophica bacterium]|nr:MarR family transcriptional regulator [Candidatus Omnitrophota bacterium]MBU4479702.1 MarR family transcriptional regulator [Candidatus Omnitrophota bacterium]MCG2703508.1 MarR family transcriptional regulator [Candidatus Omnitrophota bacterium]
MDKQSLQEFAEQLVRALPQLMRGVLSRQTDALARGKVTAPQFVVLDSLYEKGVLKMGQLAAAQRISLPAMTGLVQRLCMLKLVKRLYDEKDRRVISIDLTPAGKQLVKTFRAQREKIIVEIFGRLTEQERREYLRIVLKLNEILYKDEKK